MVASYYPTQYHQWLKDDTIKVKLERNQKGTYAWEITYEGIDNNAVLGRIKSMDSLLRGEFTQVPQGTEEVGEVRRQDDNTG